MRATNPLFIFRSFLLSSPCWWLGGSFLLGTAGSSPAEILFSGQQNIAISQDFDGVYIKVDLTQQNRVVSSGGDWDLNPFFGGIGIANSPTFQPVRSGTGNEDPIIRIGATSVIDGTATFAADLDWGGSGADDESGHLGRGALQFADGKAGYLGFQLNTGTANPLYGWMRVVLTANGNGVIQSWAYDDSGAAIMAGSNGQLGQRVVTGVQETPTSAAAAGNSILLTSGGKVTFNDGATGGIFSGTIDGAGEIQIAGTGGLRLSGANAFTGTAAVQENSKLIVEDSTNLGSASVALGNSSTLVFESSAANNGSSNTFSNTIALAGSGGVLENSGTGTVEVTGAVVGSGALTKAGSGNLTLSGTNTYSGITTVTAGLLTVNGDISSSALTTVGDGAILGGSGTVGALVVASGATIAPGNSPGILSTGNYNQVGTLSLELNGVLAGEEYDQINVGGTVNLSGLLTATVDGIPTAGALLFILNNDGSDAIIGTFDGIADLDTIIIGGYEWQISYTADYLGDNIGTFTGGNDIALKAIPEPSAVALLGVSILALSLANRRRPSA